MFQFDPFQVIGNDDDNNNNDIIDSDQIETLAQSIETLEEDIKEGKKLNEDRQKDFFSSIGTLSNGLALSFSTTITGTTSQNTAMFYEQVIKYIIYLITSYLIRNFIVSKESVIRKVSGPHLYEIFIEVINFIILLFMYIISRIILSYTNFSLEDIPLIICIYFFYLVIAKNYTFAIQNKKIKND